MLLELLLIVLLLASAVLVIRVRDLFAAAMLSGITSLLAAGLYTVMDAVDVAFTEAAVGAGIITVLFLGVLSFTGRIERQGPVRPLPVLVVLATGAALVYGMSDMRPYGDPEAPPHVYLAPELIETTQSAIHIPNVVTAILGSFRGYDTLGEVIVIFTAGVGVFLLLGVGGRRRLRGSGVHLPNDVEIEWDEDEDEDVAARSVERD